VPGLITVTCTAGNAAYDVGLDKGLNGATVASRKLKAAIGTDTLNYGLFRDSGYSANWGETVGTDTQPSSAGVGLLIKTFPVYAKIVAGQASPAGLYSDSVVVTVTY
jgi:spore coat protein U-like protein